MTSDDDVGYISLTEKVASSDLIIAGLISQSKTGEFFLSVNHVLKGTFSDAILKIQDKELDNGCYEQPLNECISNGELAIILLIKEESTYLIKYSWNIIKYENQKDYVKDISLVLKESQTEQRKRKRETTKTQEVTSAIMSSLIEERESLLQGGRLTRSKTRRMAEIDKKLKDSDNNKNFQP